MMRATLSCGMSVRSRISHRSTETMKSICYFREQAMFLIEELELLYDDWEDVLIESQRAFVWTG